MTTRLGTGLCLSGPLEEPAAPDLALGDVWCCLESCLSRELRSALRLKSSALDGRAELLTRLLLSAGSPPRSAAGERRRLVPGEASPAGDAGDAPPVLPWSWGRASRGESARGELPAI